MKTSMRKLLTIAKVALTIAILWMLYKHSQLQLSLFAKFYQHPWLTLFVFGMCYVVVILHAWRWFRLNAAQNIALSFRHTILPSYIAIAFNNVLPGSVGGDFFKLYYVFKKFPNQKSNTILSIFTDRMVGLLGIFFMACAVTPFYLEALRINTSIYYLVSISIAACILCGLSFAAVMVLITGDTRARIKLRLSKLKYSQHLNAFIDALYIYRNSKLVILESLVVSILTQIILLIVVLLTSYIMELQPLPVGVYVMALVIGQIANLVPITPGGIGVGEAAFANIILILHPGALGYATVFFAWRLLSTISFLPGVLIGVFGFGAVNKKLEMEAV